MGLYYFMQPFGVKDPHAILNRRIFNPVSKTCFANSQTKLP